MKILLLKLSFLFCVCSVFSTEVGMTFSQELQKWEEADKVTDRPTKAFSTKMYLEKGLITVGSGGGVSDSGKGLRMLSVAFEAYQKFDVQQARNLLIECVEAYLIEINKTKELREYAQPFPFSFKNIEISVMFIDQKTQSFIKPPYLAVASVSEGQVYFCTYQNDLLNRVAEESYEKTLSFLK